MKWDKYNFRIADHFLPTRRYIVYTMAGHETCRQNTAQHAADSACARLIDHPDESFAYVHDAAPHMVYPFTRYYRSNSGLCGFVGEPFKTLPACLAGEDGSGWHVETWGGLGFTSVAWFPDSASAYRERLRMIQVGAWHGMKPRVIRGCNR